MNITVLMIQIVVKKCEDKAAVFKDTAQMFFVSEDGIEIAPENCMVRCRMGEGIFLTQEEAERYLKGERENGERI